MEEHKCRTPLIHEEERRAILEYIEFISDVYIYNTRDLNAAKEWVNTKYGQNIDAVFLGSDLKSDFADCKHTNIVFTDRNPNSMISTTNYIKQLSKRR